MDKVLIVDGHNLFIRYYSVISHSDPLNLGNAVVMFLNSISREIYNRGITQVYVVFDGGAKMHKQYDSNYKVNRGKASSLRTSSEDEKFFDHLYLTRQILKNIVKVIRIKYEEGDIVMSYLAEKYSKDNLVYIVSNDNDFFQLLKDNVNIIRSKDIMLTIQNYSTVLKHLEYVDPESYALWKAIRGDSCDNVSGVYGVGYKTLSTIFFEFLKNHKRVITPNDLKENMALLPKKISDKLEKSINLIDHNYRLVSLSMEWGLLSHFGRLEIEADLSKPFVIDETEAKTLMEPYKKYINGDFDNYFSMYRRLKYV